jgi:hypothetical protein
MYWIKPVNFTGINVIFLTGQENVNSEIRKRKFGWIGHTLKKRGWGNTKGRLTVDSSVKQKERKDKEWLEKIGYQRSEEKLE